MEIIRLDQTIPVGEAESVLAKRLNELIILKYEMERQAEAASNTMDELEAKYAKLQSRELWKRVTDTEDKEDEE
jgi:prefoldin subunit 5